MPPKEKAMSAKDRKKAQKALELAMKESNEACLEGEAILDKINVDKGVGVAQFPKAVTFFAKAIELNPENTQAYLLRGRCMKGMQEWQKAIDDYTAALSAAPESAEALSCRAFCAQQLGEWETAIQDWTAVISIRSDDDHAFNMRGYARSQLRMPGLKLKKAEFEHVISDFTQAVQLNDCNFYAYANRANAHYDAQEYKKAIEDYSHALHVKEDYYYVLSRRGLAYYESVLHDRMPTDLPKPAVKDAATGDAAAGKTLEQQWEEEFWKEEAQLRDQELQDAFLDQAVKDFTTYLKQHEKEHGDLDASTLMYRAHVHLLQGKLDDASYDFKKSKEIDPDLAPVVNPMIDEIRERKGLV
eukprot:TRINITY_DN33217_c0_g1_i1.p1 TRINITY_DN33217_c0_g1~~TRINITY_DN33217_c0_g1_i1.p1  ORF type:complete len:357 (+),score=151.33 TRINITY_DN33217_c0_g1_i1:69-1139(+)